MSTTVIARVNKRSQGQPNDIDFIDSKKSPIGELKITVVDAGENEAPNIEMIKPENDIDPILADAETLPKLVERKYIPTIEQEKIYGY